MSIENGIEFTGLVSRGDKAINERYRPCTFHEVIGNESNKKALAGWMSQGEKRTRTLMFTGEAGSGKTTVARILAMGLNCEEGDTVNPCMECNSCKDAWRDTAMHVKICNMSSLSTKDAADDIINSMNCTSLTGRNSVWILDEVQGMSTGSQNLMLKILENPPPSTYIILCTTNPEKIIKPLKTRCEQYVFHEPGIDEIKKMLSSVVKAEMPSMQTEQKQEIFKACMGLGYREILMKLGKFINGGGTESIAEAFQSDYATIFKKLLNGDYLGFVAEISKNSQFEIEACRRYIRAGLSNQIDYMMKSGDYKKAIAYSKAFPFFDHGFYTDPSPMPSFKIDAFNAIMAIIES